MTAYHHSRRRWLLLALLLSLVLLPTPTMAKDSDAEAERKKKAAAKRRRQRRDARMVQKILRAASNEDHYGVLGIRNWGELHIPPRVIAIPKLTGWNATLPGFQLFRVSSDQIKRAYRSRAVAVHPDKNRDPNADQAFIAVEQSASILLEESTRAQYDQALMASRRKRRQVYTQKLTDVLDVVLGTLKNVLWTAKSVLGPFAFPALILGALII